MDDYLEGGASEPDYNIYDMTEQDVNDALARDFLSGIDETREEEGFVGYDPLNQQKGVGSGQSYASVGVDASKLASPTNKSWFDKLLSSVKSMGGKAGDFDTSERGLFALMLAALASRDRRKPTGGGVGTAYAGYKPIQRTIAQGKYGPYATYAAQGGLMQAYAQGGQVRPFPMQDGGFVMTGDAVKGAGGFEGLRQHIPEARPIIGPGTKTSDSIPAYIQGPRGRTPAAVSNGEAYVPPGRDTRGLYALMRSLERRA